MESNHILVCVQDLDHAELFAYNLKKAGYQPIVFTTGDIIHQALLTKPGMVILGSTLEDQEKAFLSKNIKENPELSHTLVVCLTTNDSCPLMDSPIRFFIDACLILPQKPKKIIKTIKHLFARKPDSIVKLSSPE